MRREERVTVQGPVKEQQPDGMSHRGYLPPFPCVAGGGSSRGVGGVVGAPGGGGGLGGVGGGVFCGTGTGLR